MDDDIKNIVRRDYLTQEGVPRCTGVSVLRRMTLSSKHLSQTVIT
jgi:hypothetical protein